MLLNIHPGTPIDGGNDEHPAEIFPRSDRYMYSTIVTSVTYEHTVRDGVSHPSRPIFHGRYLYS